MTLTHLPQPPRLLAAVVGAVAAATALSACGSSSPAATATPASSTQAHAAANVQRGTLHAATVTVSGHREKIVVTAAGRPVYLLTGDSRSHPECESTACLGVWPAVTASHPSASGLSAKLGVWRHHGISEVTLNGHPLYLFAGDSGSAHAAGQGIHSFGGVWYVLSANGAAITRATATSAAATSGSSSSGSSGPGYGSGY